MTYSHTFSRSLRQLRMITSSFDWLTVLSVSFVIGQIAHFGFGLTTLSWKPLDTMHESEEFSDPSLERDKKNYPKRDDSLLRWYIRVAAVTGPDNRRTYLLRYLLQRHICFKGSLGCNDLPHSQYKDLGSWKV